MPMSVSMHACSAWPVNIDFTAFSFFLKGYSVEETVEQLMALQTVAPEKSSAKRRTSSASSAASDGADSAVSTSSQLSVQSPNNSAESLSPSGSVPRAAHARHQQDRSRDGAAQRRRESKNDTAAPAATASSLQVSESGLLTEDKRVTAEEEQPEELTVSPMPSQPGAAATAHASAGATDSVGAHTPSAAAAPAAITAVDTSTNATRPSHTSALPSSTHSRPFHTSPSHDVSAKTAPPQSSSHHTRQHHRRRHHHHHRHSSTHESAAHNANSNGNTYSNGKQKNKKSRHGTTTTTATATVSATTSFALPPMWSNDSGAGSSQQTRRNSATVMSADDFTTADGVAAKMNDGSHNSVNNNASTVAGVDGKNSSFENRHAARQKRRKERQCFFLNDDYITFQRQLQEVEAIGGAGMGASSLQSRFLFEEVTEQFQAFRELSREEQLGSPYAFLSNYYVPIPVAARLELLQMYYETDPGLFRWAFGDKLNRFDLPGALAAAREEFVSDNPSASHVNKSLFGTSGNGALNGGTNSGASGASGDTSGGLVSSFWSGRWKSSPGKLATMDAVTLARLSEQHTDSLRRQWENVKHVCVTVASLYRGKGGMCVPLDMSLLTTIQQCFGLRHEQALDYATAAFGYEHRLETRLFDRLNTFSEYGTICSIVASVWCDDSGYFLSESFRAGCRRMGRLLDEYRLLSELHPFIFGEPMRPRWQVQLDEVQRVIATSSLVDKNTMASATAAVAAGSPVAPVASPTGLSVTGAGAAGGVGLPIGLSGGGSLSGSGGAGGWENGGSSSLNATPSSANNNSNSTSSSANVHSHLSGNGQYSRRFLMEFPSLMKHLLRICVALGNNGGVNDALDIFFTRIYSYLELLSSRSAPAIVSMVMNATSSGALSPAGLFTTSGGEAATAAGNAAGAFGKPPLPPQAERVLSHADLAAHGGREVSVSTASAHASSPAQSVSGPSSPSRATATTGAGGGACGLRMPKSMSAPSLSGVLDGDRREPSAADTLPPIDDAATARTGYLSECRPSSNGVDDVLVAGSSAMPYAASAVVNTSLFHPASALLPLSAAIAAHNTSNNNNSNTNAGSIASSLLTTTPSGRGFGAEEQSAVECSATGHGAPHGSGSSSANVHTGPVSASALFTSQVGDMVRKAVDKRYLRELCMLLAALPKAWRQLTMPTCDDHAATDKTMTSLSMALKAITQVLMASDDFR